MNGLSIHNKKQGSDVIDNQTSGRLSSVTTALVLAVSLVGCHDKQSGTRENMSAVQVDVATVLSRPTRQWDEFNGRVAATESVEVRPRVSGYVERIAFTEGAEVRRGDLLFVIDQRPYRAALDGALAQLERARAAFSLAQLQNRRAQALLHAAATSEEDAEIRQANYKQGLAEVRTAEAVVATARLNMQFTEVRAPVSGRVSRALLTVGNLAVSDQTPLTSVVSQDPVYVYFDPDEHSYLDYRARALLSEGGGAPEVRIGLAGEEGFPHAGSVDFFDNQIDPGTGTIHMRAVVRNQDLLLTPGLFARVQLAGDHATQTVLIDDKAVLTDQDRRYVYVLAEGNKALRQDVKTGRMSDGLRTIESGLREGDKVIVNGLQRVLFSGAPIKPIEVPMATAPHAAAPPNTQAGETN